MLRTSASRRRSAGGRRTRPSWAATMRRRPSDVGGLSEGEEGGGDGAPEEELGEGDVPLLPYRATSGLVRERTARRERTDVHGRHLARLGHRGRAAGEGAAVV